jgi:MFS family permease
MVLAHRRALRIVVMVDTAVTITSAAFLVVEPLYARHVLHRPPAQFALFEAAAGIGSMVAGLALSRIKAQPTGEKMLSISAACYGLAACLFIGITSVPVAYTGAFVWGVTGALFGTVALTTLQRAAPVHAHGRIMGMSAAIRSWVETIGLPLGGVTLAGLGIRAGGLALSGVAIAAGIACLVLVAGHGGEPDNRSEEAGQPHHSSREEPAV